MPLPITFSRGFQARRLTVVVVTGVVLCAPSIASAEVGTFSDLIALLVSLVRRAVPALFSLALLLFFWGIAKFILNSGSEDAATEGRNTMFFGVIALFVIFSVWGIVSILENTFFP